MTPLVLDLAETTGTNAVSAARMLGSALEEQSPPELREHLHSNPDRCLALLAQL